MDEISNDFLPPPETHRDLVDAARLAFIYGFPSYQTARLRFRALKQPQARLNAFAHARTLLTPASGLTTPRNADVLKSAAWLDLSRGPLILHVPGDIDRYYSLALMDFFTNNFAVLGRRSAGTFTGDYLLAGPKWEGAAPAGMTLIRSATNSVWALARVAVYGPEDIAEVNAIQDRFTVARSGLPAEAAPRSAHPLSAPVRSLNTGNVLMFFDGLNAALTENPPPATDQVILDRLRAIGVGPSLTFNRDNFTRAELKALREGISSANEALRGQGGLRKRHSRRNGESDWPSDALLAQLRGGTHDERAPAGNRRSGGWSGQAVSVGNFGTDYLQRARSAVRGIGGLPCEDAMFFIVTTDAAGAPLTGRNRYVLRFPPGGMPPVDAFWSLSIYRTDENRRRALVPSPSNRGSLGSRTSGLRYGKHGSLEILIQREQPNTRDENWLPAPDDAFQVTLRTYLPRRELVEGAYAIPKVRLLSE